MQTQIMMEHDTQQTDGNQRAESAIQKAAEELKMTAHYIPDTNDCSILAILHQMSVNGHQLLMVE